MLVKAVTLLLVLSVGISQAGAQNAQSGDTGFLVAQSRMAQKPIAIRCTFRTNTPLINGGPSFCGSMAAVRVAPMACATRTQISPPPYARTASGFQQSW